MRCDLLKKMAKLFAAVAAASTTSGCFSSSGYVMNSSGQNYYQQGNYQAAASEFERAMINNPSNPDYIANLAKARAKTGDAAASEQLYRQALTIAPSHQPSYHGLAELMVSQGRTQEASSMLNTWAATQPYVAESHLELAWLQRQTGNQTGAVQSLQKALEVNPAHSTALAHLGQHYQDMGRPDQAVTLYQQSLRADWNQPEVHSRLASAAQATGGAHPMAATAMARGVHPYEMARQQSVFGPPSQGAQMAQLQMQQMQMAQASTSGYPVMTTAFPGMTTAQQSPFPASTPVTTAGFQSSPSGLPTTAQMEAQLNAGLSQPGGQPTRQGDWTVVPGSYKVIDSGMPQNAGTVAAAATGGRNMMPTPDAHFSAAGQGTPTVSVSAPSNTSPFSVTSSASEPPVLDAF